MAAPSTERDYRNVIWSDYLVVRQQERNSPGTQSRIPSTDQAHRRQVSFPSVTSRGWRD